MTSVMVLMTVIRNKENVKRVYIECELKSQNFVTRLELRTSRKFRLKFGVAELNDGNFLDVWFPKPRYEEFDCMFIEIWSSSILLSHKLAIMKLDFSKVYENKGILIVWVWDKTLLSELKKMLPLFVHTLGGIFKSQLGVTKLDFVIEEKRGVIPFFR